MSLTRLLPNFERFDGLSQDDQSWVIAKSYGICNGWRLNFAIDSSGNSFGNTGSSADVSNDLDRLLLGKLRSLSDVIVTSGKTARLERYRSSKHAPIAIFTTSGDLDSVPAIQGTQYFTPLVMTPSAGVDTVEENLSDVDVLVRGYSTTLDESRWPKAVAELIHGEGYQSPILESGQATLREFIANDVIEEICLSVTQPRSSGVSARDLNPAKLAELFGPIDAFSLSQVFSDGNTTFTLWRRGSLAT